MTRSHKTRDQWIYGGFLLALVALLAAGLFWLHVKDQPPVPGPDTGWHMAIDRYGDTYWADSRYDEAPKWLKDDMNRFTRANPNGGYDPVGSNQ